jgi:hypothetical protein
MVSALVERYSDRISGVLSCYDRVVVTGTLPTVCYADGMTRFLYAYQIRIFDYPEFAMVLRERVREAAASLAAEAEIAIEHVAKGHIRKEAIVAQVLEQRGEHPAWFTSSRRWRPATPTSHGSSARSFASRRPPTTCPSSSTTEGWNTATARQRAASPPSRKPSTA